MDLLEYQAKELFSQVGIPVLPSQTISEPRELKRLQIPYPIVLKSQVRVGGRGRAGGIRFVENTIDAIAAARTIFNLPIVGEYPEVLLAEARYDTEREFFLAVVLDYQLKRPVLLGSIEGGMDVEALLEHLQMVVVESEFSPFYARRLAIKMGLQGELILSLGVIIQKMYNLFLEKDLDLIEINPLGVSAKGEMMALDGKISVNDNALGRHPDILSLTAPRKKQTQRTNLIPSQTKLLASPLTAPRWLDWKDEKGRIAVICNSFALTVATWDLISQEKGKLACCLVVGEKHDGRLLSTTFLREQLNEALDGVMEFPELRVVLINILGGAETTETVAAAIADYLLPSVEQTEIQRGEERHIVATGSLSRSEQKPTFVSKSSKQQTNNQIKFAIRLVGGEIEEIKTSLEPLPIYWTDSLDKAVEQAISLAKSK